MSEQDITRAKILGVLIQDARLHAERSVADCARVLHMSTEQFTRAERGEHVISLPELEVLAIYLDVPMAHFWGSQTLGPAEKSDYAGLLALRHKIIGGLLQQARLEAGVSEAELGEAIGVSMDQIQAYQTGELEIPLLQLENLAKFLGVSLDYFIDNERGPLGRHEAQQRLNKHLEELPNDLKDFVAAPINISYLETAKRLSEMDVKRLRRIAEGILDITF